MTTKHTDGLRQIPEEILTTPCPETLTILGEWTKPESLSALRETFARETFPHVIIPNFFKPEFAEAVVADWPKLEDFSQIYHNPFEQRQATPLWYFCTNPELQCFLHST